MSLTPVGDLGIALKADIDDYQKSMATASDLTGSFTGIVRNLGSAMRNTGLLITAASAVSGAAMVALTQRAQRVNSAFREVDTISREVSDAQREYGELVTDLNTQFGIQADKMEVIDGLYQSVSAGVTEGAESQREFLETAAQLAVVGRVDLATSVDVLSTVMNTYGMETDMARDVSESLFQTVQFGKVRMEELAPVLGRVAALGSEMNVQIDEIGASMAVLTRTGFEARVAATGLRNIFRAMMRPSETMQGLLRDIALENEQIASQWNNQSDLGNDLAQTYRDTAEAVRELENAQSEARQEVEDSSLVIQEARLKIQAIEEDRVSQLGELTSAEVENADSVEDLQGVIEDYRFKTNRARVEEEQHRLEMEEQQAVLSNLRQDFKDNVDIQGDLEGSVGNLVLQEQDFIDTLVELRQRANEQNIAFNELFPRTRALQGALALVGEDGQLLTDIFKDMEKGSLDTREAWDEMDDAARSNFDSFEDFKESTENLQEGDLDQWFEEATGPQQEMRNAMSELSESASNLGDIFSEDVTNTIQNFSETINNVATRIGNLEDRVRSNISRFAILAVSLGLLIGPLLLVGGQLAIIASVMGVSLIPFLAVAGVLFGLLASAISTAISDGDGAEDMFGSMQNAIGSVIGFLSRLHSFFVFFILPGLKDAGEGFMDVFDAVQSAVSSDTDFDFWLVLADLFNRVGDAFSRFGAFLSEHADTFAQIAVVIVNRVIPALSDFAAGVIAVLQDIDWSVLIPIAGFIGMLALGLIELLGVIGRWMQRNSELIGTLITWAIVIGGIIAIIGKLAITLGPLLAGLATFVKLVMAITLAKGLAAGAIAAFVGIGVKLAALFPLLVKGISVVIGAVKLLAAGFGILASFITLPMVAIALLITAFVAIIAAAWFLRDEIIEAFKIAFDTVKEILGIFHDFLTGEISWKAAGAKIVKSLAGGLMDGISVVEDATKKVTDAIGKYLPTSPADKGYFNTNPPEEIGSGITEDIGKGMDTEGDIEEQFKDFDTSKFDVEKDMQLSGQPGIDTEEDKKMPKMGKEEDGITVEEGAIRIGPFHGISDEELPEKVEEEVDESLEQLVEDLRAKGIGGE